MTAQQGLPVVVGLVAKHHVVARDVEDAERAHVHEAAATAGERGVHQALRGFHVGAEELVPASGGRDAGTHVEDHVAGRGGLEHRPHVAQVAADHGNAVAGKVVGSVKIGNGPDGAGYDPGMGLAFSPNGQDGTLDVIGKDGEFLGQKYDETDIHIVCPWHGYEYDLKTGQCIGDKRLKLRAYKVVKRGDDGEASDGRLIEVITLREGGETSSPGREFE